MTSLELMILHLKIGMKFSKKRQDFGNPQATTYCDIQWHKTYLNQVLYQNKALSLYNYTQYYFTKTWNLRMGKWQMANNMESF